MPNTAVADADPRVEKVWICTPDKDLGQCVVGDLDDDGVPDDEDETLRTRWENEKGAIQRVRELKAAIDEAHVEAMTTPPMLADSSTGDYGLGAVVHEIDGGISGFSIVGVAQSTAYLQRIAVDPAHGRQGIGRCIQFSV